jgi:ParB-like chromosome segregation protein Spo0J
MGVVAKETALHVSLDALTEKDGWNVRLPDDPDNLRHIEELAESIYHVGVLEALTAYREGDKFVVTNGHCRLAAARLAVARGADIKALPVRLEPRHANEADHNFSMIARNKGKPLSALELGIVLRRMLGWGWTEQLLAERSGYGIQHIRNCMLLAAAPAEVVKLVETGKVAPTLATGVLQAEGAAEAAKLLTKAVVLAEAEQAAVPKPRQERPPSKLVKKPAGRATLQHVKAAKGHAAVDRRKGKRPAVQPDPPAMMPTGKLVEQVLAAPTGQAALSVFEMFGNRRAEILGEIIARAAAPRLQGSRGNGRPPEFDTLRLILERSAIDQPEQGIVTLVMNADDADLLCDILKVEKKADPLAGAAIPDDEPELAL